MSTPTDPNELGPVPRKVRVVGWRLLAGVVAVSVFLLPHTVVGVLFAYVAIGGMILLLTGIELPNVRVDGSPFLVWLAGAFWDSLLVVIWVFTWGQVCTEYKLLVRGTATTGSVFDKRSFVTGAIAHGIGYEITFTHPHGKGAMRVDAACFQELSVGDSVTVLYDPRRPTRAIICEGCVVFGLRLKASGSTVPIS